jgi:alpha-galactosidase
MNARLFRLDGARDSQWWVSDDGAMPRLLYWGAPLAADEDPWALARALEAPVPQGGLDVAERVSWLPEPGRGFTDLPGIELRRGEQRLVTQFVLREAARTPLGWCFQLDDAQAAVALTLHLALHATSGVFSAWCELRNDGVDVLSIDTLATLCLPLPAEAEECWSIGGAWSAEFHARREPIGHALWLQEARTGRPSHHAFPGLSLLQRGANATEGSAWSAQIAWSGNHRIAVQRTRGGGGQWQLGELLLPGELTLASGQTHRTPAVHVLRSPRGLRELSAAWHRFVRERVLPPQPPERARRVQLNTWEACYFDHRPERLASLAGAAAAVGVERFVLDDGWFGARRNDRAGLGDWWPSSDVYPQGLAPLAEHCRALGMQFGLWVEPEGVNADSDLYRAHPDWVLHVPGREQPLGRHQFVLDLGRAEVREHLFAHLAAVLRGAPIDFLKWDMNRDFTHEAGADGRAGVRAHVLGLYELLARLREDFPTLEIETCASGGGRADLGMLAHCRRVWVSDCNDPLERQRMQATFLHFLPPEVMGSHVGPSESHTTGRVAGIGLRTLNALLGHLGIEADASAMSEDERSALRDAVAVYKEARSWLATATVTAIDSGDDAIVATLAVAADASVAWLTLVATERSSSALPRVLRLPGLDATRRYRVGAHSLWPAPARGLKQGGFLDGQEVVELNGQTLRDAGVRLPLLWPGSGCLLVLHAR